MLVSMQYDYGDLSRPESYEYVNFYDTLKRMGHEVIFFDFMQTMSDLGQVKMNSKLLEVAQKFSPNIAIVSLYTDQLLPDTISLLRTVTKTLCFFHDDMWRRDFALKWAPYFDFFSSSSVDCERKYQRLGLNHIIHFPFGVNSDLYKPLNLQKKYDVTFVGQFHPYRAWLIKKLRKKGIDARAFGRGWDSGALSHDQMMQVFSQSKINLNLSNSTSWDARYLLSSPRGLVDRIRSQKDVEQLKARHFEIPACGGFELSYYVDGLERYYEIDEEIGVFISPDDLIVKVQDYLSDESAREIIAQRGYERTLRDHTYAKRFDEVFSIMGISNRDSSAR